VAVKEEVDSEDDEGEFVEEAFAVAVSAVIDASAEESRVVENAVAVDDVRSVMDSSVQNFENLKQLSEIRSESRKRERMDAGMLLNSQVCYVRGKSC